MKKQVAVVVGVLVVGLGFGYGAYRMFGKPHTTADQKYAIRTMQNNYMSADSVYRGSAKFKACVADPVCTALIDSQEFVNIVDANTNLANSIQAVFSAQKADPNKYTLDPNLDFVDKPKSVINPSAAPVAPPTPATVQPAVAPAQLPSPVTAPPAKK